MSAVKFIAEFANKFHSFDENWILFRLFTSTLVWFRIFNISLVPRVLLLVVEHCECQ